MALTQQRYTFHHDQVLYLLTTKLKVLFTDYLTFRVTETPQATIPTALVTSPVLYNSSTPSVALLEL